jgi:hypothetical protein
MYNHPAEASENKSDSRLRRTLDRGYSSTVVGIILHNNKSGKTNIVKRVMKILEDSYHIKTLYNMLLKYIHILGFKYENVSLEEISFMIHLQTCYTENSMLTSV